MSTTMSREAARVDSARELLASEHIPIRQRITRVQALQVVIVLVVLIAIFSAMAPEAFPTWFNFRNILQNTAIFAVLGVGATFVIITAGIDLSIGSVLVFSSVVSAQAMGALGSKMTEMYADGSLASGPLANALVPGMDAAGGDAMMAFGPSGWLIAVFGVLVALASGCAWGLLNGFLIAKAKVPAFIVTLGTLGMALGLSQVITGGVDVTSVPAALVENIGFGDLVWQLPALVVIAAIIVVAGGILLHRTLFGLYTYAVGSNPEGCRRVGIKVDRQLMWVYVLSGATAGIAGIMSLALYQQTTIGGQSLTNLTVIAGVVIGGTSLFGGIGTMFGTVIGLLIPVVLQSGFIIIGVESFWQNVVIGMFLIAAVYIDGLRRARATRSSGRKARHLQVGGVQLGNNRKEGTE